MRACTVALVQMRALDELGPSLRSAIELTEQALDAEADLVVLPENHCGIGAPARRRRWAFDPRSPQSAPSLAPLCALSERNRAVIIAGGVPEAITGTSHTYNTQVVIHRGRIVATYRKVHLFDADLPESAGGGELRESAYTRPGSTLRIVQTPAAAVGLSICYDLRFAELYRALAAAGAEVLVAPSAFTLQTGLAHWEPLLRARAIETQCYVLAAAQRGVHAEGRHSYGHTMVIDPWGAVIAQASDRDQILLAHLQPDVLESARKRIPCGDHHVLPADPPVDVVTIEGAR